MIRALLALLARVLADPAPAVDDVADLVPADCDDCGYPLGYCACGYGYDVTDYYDYVVKANR